MGLIGRERSIIAGKFSLYQHTIATTITLANTNANANTNTITLTVSSTIAVIIQRVGTPKQIQHFLSLADSDFMVPLTVIGCRLADEFETIGIKLMLSFWGYSFLTGSDMSV